jgi:glyoxylase-like metal-dependent hydrolase (beta-lactamase superfamily II)
VSAVPGNAKGPVLDLSQGLAIDEIADGVFLITDGDYQALCADTEDGVIAFDAPPWGPDHLAAIRRVSRAPITRVVYSHAHHDHIGGAHLLSPPEIVSHSATADILRRHADQRRPVPTTTFDEELGYIAAHDSALSYDFSTLVAGHLVPHGHTARRPPAA